MYTLILLLGGGANALIAGTYATLESCDYSGRAAMNAKLEYICLPRDAAKPVARPKAAVPMPRPAPVPKIP